MVRAVSTPQPALDGARLFADVLRYESFGHHRFGSPGAAAAFDWIESELGRAGLAVSAQRFTMPRQYDFRSGTLAAGNARLDVVPHWWSPEDKASFALTAPIGPGGFARIDLPFDRGAYLSDSHRAGLAGVLAQRPAAVLLCLQHPSGEIFSYNVDQTGPPWPVPVILVAPKDRPALDAAQQAGTPVSVAIDGTHRRDVEGRNVVARLDRGKGKWLIVSTPVTSWFTSTCERAPGIAGFLAMARMAETFANVDLLFVATAGHEIGHGGMQHFIRELAPPPAATVAWAHFGASLACREIALRLVNSSEESASLVDRHFASLGGTRLTGPQAGIGELREILAAGYPRFFSMTGNHRYFHTPADTSALTSPELLAPAIRPFASALAEIDAAARFSGTPPNVSVA